MKMTLRTYQQEAIDAVYAHLRKHDDNPCVVIPTGGGKTPVMATMCKDAVNCWNGRVLILAHVRELLEQAVHRLNDVAPELWHRIGIYSAGLKSRDTEHPIIVAGIQSVYKRAGELGPFDLIIIDESHMIPPSGDGMYRQFLSDAKIVNPLVRTIGLTATPFRMTTGMICTPDNFLNAVCFEVSVRELIVQGYLCPLRTKAGREKADTDSLHVRGGEYVAGEVEAMMDENRLVESACREIIDHTQDRHSCLIFASGVRHGRHITRVLEEVHGIRCGFVCGETPAKERDRILSDFRNGDLPYLCNVNVLTMGFDAPNIGCVAMVRPTLSPGLYYQMVGRGFRTHPGKPDCLILDFGGNVLRHGPVDQIRIEERNSNGDGEAPAKECPQCHALIAAGYAVCPECGHEFPERERSSHEPKASTEGILSGQSTITEYELHDVYHSVHTKRDADEGSPKTMRVEYEIGFQIWISEWICFEHTGYARVKAESWWRERSREPVPMTADDAVEIAESGGLAKTVAIKVKSVVGEKYDRIVGYTLGPKPRLPGWEEEEEGAPARAWIDMEEVPF